ncbi:MAG TPA: hypothetical protein VGP93_19395 [Polyangiaceae bacterium]|nr:hypothetical protein [Polyangiaceae bacterium]
MSESPLDQLLEGVRAALHGRRAAALERVQRIERALGEYVAAVEERIGREFAREHGLAQPKPPRDVVKAAEALRAAVQALPELSEPAQPPLSEPAQAPALESPAKAPLAQAHQAPIVVVGGVPKRERAAALPRELGDRIEWIDTTRQGTVAIGNLTQRIRGGRVAALVLLEALVGHRHSEPLVSAAREAGIPWAYAGKGGRGAFERALGDVLGRLA